MLAEITAGNLIAAAGVVVASISLVSVLIGRSLNKIDTTVKEGLAKVNERIDQHMTAEEDDREADRRELTSVKIALVHIAAKVGVQLPGGPK